LAGCAAPDSITFVDLFDPKGSIRLNEARQNLQPATELFPAA
jgi:hypothetical protein